MKDSFFMQRCLTLAESALGKTSPNPMVGCVIVHKKKIIGEGFHEYFGGPHAEVNALSGVKDSSVLKNSEMYVSLEPCTHSGKTPPCVDAIIQSGIKKVIIASKDPLHSGGIESLKNHGIKVTEGVLEKEALSLNKRFFTAISNKRPYIILKWAQTNDGVIGKHGGRLHISSPQSLTLSHRWRSEEAAILVGANTILADNPSLTTRLVEGMSPTRVVLDKNGLINDLSLNVFKPDAKTIIYSPLTLPHTECVHIEEVQKVLEDLCARGIDSVIVEGGVRVLTAFIEQRLFDELRVFISPFDSKLLENEKILAPVVPADATLAMTWKDKAITGGDELRFYEKTHPLV